jgi:hypothetical protein
MSRATPLREAVKATFYPFALERGFVREKATSLFVPFRRMAGSTVQVFEIQWDKSHRPRFVVNFGEAPSTGIEFFGEHVSAELLNSASMPGARPVATMAGRDHAHLVSNQQTMA